MEIHRDGARSVLRKIVITTLIGAISFPLTNVVFQTAAEQLAMTAAVGAVVLIVQFLVEVDHRLSMIESKQFEHADETKKIVRRGFSSINDATRLYARMESVGLRNDSVTQLMQKAAEVGKMSPLVSGFVQSEIDRLSVLFHGLASEHVTYNGEDRDWLLALTRTAQKSIDAVSLPAVDAGGESFDGGFWGSALGYHYLDLQYEAIQRGVQVRRLFVVNRPEFTEDPNMLSTCRSQADLGITVRLLYPSAVPSAMQGYLFDFILFDDVLSYEVEPAFQVEHDLNPVILHTRLVLNSEKMIEHRRKYELLWRSGRQLP
jgi:hypothetical protein